MINGVLINGLLVFLVFLAIGLIFTAVLVLAGKI